ncbi:Lipopolysaccharide assembly protein B [Candidatus Magnetaquicoccaceae bacterium FCR-1]|uniref:protein O-GlcNAc transferase n=1 Tax=Candidatus Magnetaquiglobus chichijimensis TaxID=3141448 RepID=A0ABQ0CD01_9PROT
MKSGKSKHSAPAAARSVPVAPVHKALELHHANRLAEAEALYRQILRETPRHQDALNLLGYLLHQRGERDEAIALIKKAIAIDPNQPLFHNNLGIVLQNHGQPEAALAAYDKALQLDPNYQAAMSNLGTLHQALGQYDEAIACQERALKIQPNFFEAYANMGNIRCEQKRFDEAIACYEQSLAIYPEYVSAMHNLAYVLQKLERHEEALVWLERALELRPDYLEALNCKGNVLQDLGRWSEAIACYEQALAINPLYYEALCNMGNVLCDQGRLDESIACHQRALAIKPDLHESYTHMGNALQLQERLDEAIACYRKALEIRPDDQTALENLGVACNVRGDLEGAIDCARRLIAQKRDDPNTFATLLNLLKQICDWRDLDDLFSEMMQLFNAGNKLINPFVFLTLPTTPAEQLACATHYMDRKYRARRDLAATPTHDPHPRRLKIGYLSCDFLNHATAILMAELIKLHDRERFEIILYSYSDDDGKEMRQRMVEASDRFVDLLRVDHDSAARTIHEDGIHVLVELKGFTKGARLEIATQRPAPLQVSWLGYPGTMGAGHIDYIVADPFLIPAGEEIHYSEKVVRLPHCYQPNDRLRALPESGPTRAECGLPARGLIFSNFNQTYKITPEIFAVWMEVLHHTPEAILWLLESNPLVADNLRQAAAGHGIDPARLHFAPKLAVAEHLARYHLVDLVLDTYPVTSHTTASDALWIGCPLLTIAGDTFVSRVAGSLLVTMDAPELVATTLADYQAKALELARAPERLTGLRARLIANRATTPLFDTPRFTRDLESVYEAIWQRHAAGLPPEHLDIAPSFPTPDQPIQPHPTASAAATTPVPPPVAPPIQPRPTASVAATTPVPPPVVPLPALHIPPQAPATDRPVELSICITTASGRAWLAHTLEQLRWVATSGRAIEVVVVDLPEANQGNAAPGQPGAGLPLHRHVTLPRPLAGQALIQAALRVGRGRFLVHLACGDRLLPETLLAELDLMLKRDDIAVSHAPWQLWNDSTATDMGLFYPLEGEHLFDTSRTADLFNFIALNHIFPENALYRADALARVSFDLEATHTPLVTTFRTLSYGAVRFQPNPFLVSVLRNPGVGAAQRNEGMEVLAHLDHYRSGLELAASLALASLGMNDFDPGNRAVVLELINDFVVRRILVAANLAQASGDYIAAGLCLKRALLWVKSEEDRALIRAMEPNVMTGSAYQAMRDRFFALPDAKALVACRISNPEVIRASLHQIAPTIPFEIRDPESLAQSPERFTALCLTEDEATRGLLIASGLPAGQVLLTSDLLGMFRVTG